MTKRKTFPKRIAWRFIIAVLLMLTLIPISPNPVAALSVSDYFSYSYTVQFSKSQITGGETFYATVQVTATYIKALPVPATPTEASSTGRIVAIHQTSGAKLTLNPSYTVTLSPFPSVGQTTQISQAVPLQFLGDSQIGAYNVVGELIKAEVNLPPIIGWMNITTFLPSSQSLGSVTYGSDSTSSDTPPPPMPTSTQTPTPTPSPTPKPTPAPSTTSTPSPSSTPAPLSPKPAKFELSNLAVTPGLAKPGETVTVSATASNTGDSTGKLTVVLIIDGAEEDKRELTLAAGASEKVSFNISRSTAKTYQVLMNELAAAFTVQAVAPSAPTSPSVPKPLARVNWWLVGGIIAAVLVAGVLIRRLASS